MITFKLSDFQALRATRGEIATKLTLISVILMSIGLFFGLNSKRISTETHAASTCEYTFSTPQLTRSDNKLICTVPTSKEHVSTIGCSLAQNDQWAADSKFLNGVDTTVRFELTLHDGKGAGEYSLIAYEFDGSCSHEDQVVQVSVEPNAPTQTPTQAPVPTNDLSPTPTPIPECIAQNIGECMSQALCTADTTVTEVGDLGCSELRSDWVCCSSDNTQAPLQTPTSTPTLVPATPTNTPSPIDAPRQSSRQGSNIAVTTKTCTQQVSIVASNKQSWAYRVNSEGQLEIVPIIGEQDKQRVVDTICK